jgi:hypothetical protein
MKFENGEIGEGETLSIMKEALQRKMYWIREVALPARLVERLVVAGTEERPVVDVITMRHDLGIAEKALAEGDLTMVIAAYKSLRGYLR